MSKHLLLAIPLLAGCALAPEYQRAAPPVPLAWPVEVQSAIPDASGVENEHSTPAGGTAVLPPLGEHNWQQYFLEPDLQVLIASALENNRDQQVALARVDEARALAASAGAGRWPALDLVTQRNVTHIPGDLRLGNDRSAGLTAQRYDTNLAASYELDFWGRVASLDAAAKASFLASDFARNAVRVSLIADVASAYYLLKELYYKEYLLEQVQYNRMLNSDLVRQRRDVGVASELEFVTAQSGLHNAQGDLAGGVRARIQAQNAVRLLAGVEPSWDDLRAGIPATSGGAGDKAGALAPAPRLPAVPLATVNVPATALLRRPDVQAAEQKLKAANANIAAARAAFLPRINLTAAAGTASAALDGLFAAGSGAWSFVPLLRVPIFDAGSHDADLDLAKARRNVAVADYERTLQQAFRDVADVLAAAKFGAEQVDRIYRAADNQVARYTLVAARFNAGIVNRLEFLDAQRDALNAQQVQLTARRQTQVTAANVFRVLGGS